MTASAAEPTPLPASLVELTAGHVRGEVLSGVLAPGERVGEEALCAKLGISRAPVREALRRLAEQGFVEHLPRRGYRVVVWSATDVLELFEVRRALELHALATALPTPDLPTRLRPARTALAELAEAAERRDWQARDDAHRRFHIALVAVAGNRQLDLIYSQVLMKLQLAMAWNLQSETDAAHHREGVRRHEELLAAIATNDPATATAALTDHGERTYLKLARS
ncbi:GntR family transcriptional regulator [Nocardia camponoti]|uniref:Transcriptional regulator, GntR family protein n=1 Tax=Nocardia camponoti TaxID=1616106 RepID=A0A917V3M6_9NOCA|nr:GntR family transcriptional regulator [Nocardia camponoti]GGK35099.1 putative transcriptional regulator, GntR family protein [Nocardia camponoti]